MDQTNNEELLKHLQNQQEKQSQLLKQIERLEHTVKQHLTKEAITRYGNLKAGHPEKAMQAIAVLAQLIQAGQIKKKLSDEEFKTILKHMQQKKEFKITKK
jgi:DNA-binding TFAR19-related protein (PDSD5 family)